MNKNSLLSFLALALLTGGLSLMGCGENAVPENPSWSRDIQPLMEAHCVRCHGGGGTLNGDPDVPPNFKNGICPPPTDGGAYDCTPTAGNFTTQAGLMVYTASGGLLLKGFLAYPMPPPPSEPLTDYEYNLLMDWAAHPLP
jgi:hypothetical protein